MSRFRGAKEVRDIRAAPPVRDSALKFKQARAYETDEIEAAHGNRGDTPWQRRIQGEGRRFVSRERRDAGPSRCTATLSIPPYVEVDPRATFRYRSTKPSAPRYLVRKSILWIFYNRQPGFYRCPRPAHQLCAGEFAWLITVRRVPAPVDRLNERWRMRP